MRLLFNVFGWMTALCPSPPVLVRCERRLPPVESWEGLRPSMNTSYEVRRSTTWSPYHRCLWLCCKHHCGIMVGGIPRDQYEPSRAHRLRQETERKETIPRRTQIDLYLEGCETCVFRHIRFRNILRRI